MDSAEIYSKLTDVFRDVFDNDSIAIHPQFSPNDFAEWDSLMHIRLLLTIEKTFRIKFSTTELGALKTVGALVGVIRARTDQSNVRAGRGGGQHDRATLVADELNGISP